MPTITGEQKQWHKVTLDFQSTQTFSEAPETFRDYRFDVTFTNQSTGETLVVPGFFAADGDAANSGATSGNIWRVHFNPPSEGNWTYQASFRTGNDIAASTNPNAGTSLDMVGSENGSLTIAATDKTGDDFRAKGMILQDEGTHYLQHQGDGDYFIRGGPGVPENFLANQDIDNTGDGRHDYSTHASDFNQGDPTWDGGKGQNIIGAINYLEEQDQNTIYVLTNTIGGDGRDVGPWVDPDIYNVQQNRNGIEHAANSTNGLNTNAFSTYDVSKLAQWDILFDHMDAKGIYKNVLFQETENDQLLNGGTSADGTTLSVERMVYMREMIARFGHSNGLQWNLGEENTNDTDEIVDMAEFVKAVDPYDHLVVIHTYPSDINKVYDPLVGVTEFDGPSFQTNARNIRGDTIEFRDKSANAGDPWVLAWDEDSSSNAIIDPGDNDPDANTERTLRKEFWGSLTANGSGGNWYIKGTSGHSFDQNIDDFTGFQSLWTWTAAATNFYNTYIPFWQMTNDDGVTTNGGDYVMSQRGSYYVVYLDYGQAGNVSLDLRDQAGSETFNAYWYDPRNGGALIDAGQVAGGGVRTFSNPPNSTGKDWVLFVRNSNLPDTPPSVDPGTVVTPPPPPSDPPPSQPPGDATFNLYNADTDAFVSTLNGDDVITLGQGGIPSFNIQAVPPSGSTVGSAVFSINGSVVQTESVAPYALYGDTGGDYAANPDLADGQYTLSVSFYSGSNGSGSLVSTSSVTFSVANGEASSPPPQDNPPPPPVDDPVGDPPSPPSTAPRDVFVENNGIVVIEMESAADFGPLPTGWETRSTYNSNAAGNVDNRGQATGGDFLIWQGGQFFNDPSNGQITYKIQITEAGTYRFEWRSQVGEGSQTSEHNDTWLKIGGDAFWGQQGDGSTVRPNGVSRSENDWPNGATSPNGSSADGFFKIYHGTQDWNFGGFTSDHDGHQIYARFDQPGIYDITIAARSSHHVIDRMVLTHVDYNYRASERHDLSLAESERTVDTRGQDPVIDPPPPPPPPPPPADDPVADPPPEQQTVTFNLINADTDTVVSALNNDDTITLGDGGLPSFNIQAVPSGTVDRIEFLLNGQLLRTEGSDPYAAYGDNGSDFLPSDLSSGTHSLTARLFSGNTQVGSSTIQFTVETVQAAPPPPPPADDPVVDPPPPPPPPPAPEDGTVSGRFFVDGDGDGQRDGNSVDPGVGNHQVDLLRNGETVQSTQTSNNGSYTFNDVPPGSGYSVRFFHEGAETDFVPANGQSVGSAGNLNTAQFSVASGQTVNQYAMLEQPVQAPPPPPADDPSPPEPPVDSGSQPAGDPIFQMENGLVVMQAEDGVFVRPNASGNDTWRLTTEFNGYKGTGVMLFDTNTDYFGNNNAGEPQTGPLKYTFRIPDDGDAAGTYFITLRAIRPVTGEPSDRNNDFFVAAAPADVSHDSVDYTKLFFSGARNQFVFGETYDAGNHNFSAPTFQVSEPGDYTIYVSGRSRQAGLDEIHVQKGSKNKNHNAPTSELVSSSSDNPPPPPPPADDPVSDPPPAQQTVTFNLINAESDTVVSALNNNDTITLGDGGLPSFNIQAVPSGTVDRVEFLLNGQALRTENSDPFAAYGDQGSDFLPSDLSDGTHSLTARLFSGNTQVGSSTIQFTVETVQAAPPPPPADDPVVDPPPPPPPADDPVIDPPPAPTVTGRLEIGSLTLEQSTPDQWVSVTFDAPIQDARVVMGPITFDGPDEAIARVRNVTDTGFEFQIDEWWYKDGWHMTETVSWMAMSEGVHT
ncbi:MAG: DUF5060 domain-containing protein, partial [Pseudomonadota bacterium]